MLALQLHRLAERSLPDNELLARFVRSRDEQAFAELVRRHGSLVLGVARRMLGDHHAAEDVLQATFLLLSRKSAKLNWRPTVGPWLYAAAFRLAKKAQRRRKFKSLDASPPIPARTEPNQPLLWQEVRTALDEELARLSRSARDPLVLCYLQGRTRDEAARALGWTLATLKRRLERGRNLLRARMTRRGLALSALGGALALDEHALPAASAHELARTVAAGTVSQSAIELLEAGAWSGSKKIALSIVMLTVVGLGGGLLGGKAPKPKEDPEPPPLAGPQLPAKKTIDVSGDPLPEGAIARLGTTRLRPGQMINAMEFLPDGKQLAVWTRDWGGGSVDRVIYYDVANGRELKSIRLPPNNFFAMRLLANGSGLALIQLDRNDLFIWQFAGPASPLPAKEKADIHTRFPGDIQAGAISPDGRWIVTGRSSDDGNDQPLELWEAKPNSRLADLKPRRLGMQSGHGMYFAFSADSKLLFSLSRKQAAADATGGAVMPGKPADRSRLVVYELPSGKQCSSFDVAPTLGYFQGIQQAPERMAVSPDGKSIWIGDESGSIHCYNWTAGKETLSFVAHPAGNPKNPLERAGVCALHLSSDGKTLYSSGQFGGFVIRDATTGKTHAAIRQQPIGLGRFFALSPDNSRLAVAENHSAAIVRVFDAKTGEDLMALPGHTGSISELRVLPDGNVMTAGWDDTVRWWDPTEFHELKSQYAEVLRLMRTWAVLTGDGTGLFSMQNNRLFYVDLGTRKQTAVTDEMPDWYSRLHGVSESTAFFTTPDGKEQQWDARGGKIRQTYTLPPGQQMKGTWPSRAAMSPDERRAVMISIGSITTGNIGYSTGSHLSLFDVKSGDLCRYWNTDEARFECCEFSGDGKYLVVGGGTITGRTKSKPDDFTLPVPARNGLLLFDGRTGEPIRAFEPAVKSSYDSYRVPAVAISPSNHLLAAVQWDNSIAIYELATGGLCHLFRGHQNQVTQLAFTADGRRLISASHDTTALVWDTSYAKLAKSAAGDRDKLWADLAKPEWQLAGPALTALAQKPEDFLALVKQNLPAADKADVDREAIAKSVKELDDQIYAVRERASASLARLGRESLPLLREHLAKVTTGESKNRLQRAIEQISRMPVPSGHLRQVRVLALLEQIQSPGARQELRRLSDGNRDSALTKDAKAALARIAAIKRK